MLHPDAGEVAFVNGHRGPANRLGVAVQLVIPVGELRSYGAREQTRTDHLREVAAFLGWRPHERRPRPRRPRGALGLSSGA
nr:hypothetical protein [Frankia sp. QA3]